MCDEFVNERSSGYDFSILLFFPLFSSYKQVGIAMKIELISVYVAYDHYRYEIHIFY